MAHDPERDSDPDSQSGIRAYLAATGFASAAIAMQQLLVAWLLIGVLLMPAGQVGMIQAIIGVPGIFIMLWGGVIADRNDPRTLLMYVYSIAPILQISLIAADKAALLNPITVTAWGIGMGTVIAFASTPQQAILNRISGTTVQRGVSAATAVQSLTQIAGLIVAGRMDHVGLTPVLLVQSVSLILAAIAIRQLEPQPPLARAAGQSAIRSILEGLRATLRDRVLTDVLVINFISSIFNAGAFITVFPFIIKRLYGGDAWLLAVMMAWFFGCSVLANLLLLKFMPLKQPGRAFLLLQLSRLLFLALLWLQPDWWLLVVAMAAWGMNMGATTALARTVVQESTTLEFRSRILSIYNLGLLGSPPIGALILGWIIETFGTLNALLPGMLTSLALFIYGAAFTGVWRYRSP